jgi:pimeloyl-ACP methyl ester carboxylesterase
MCPRCGYDAVAVWAVAFESGAGQMKKPPLWLLFLFACPVVILGALNVLAPEVTEEIAFRPPPRSVKANTEVQLGAAFFANAQSTNWKTPMRVTQPVEGVTRLTPLSSAATFLSQDARHGFANSDSERLAWTLTTLADTPLDKNRPLIVTCSGNAMDRYTAGVSYAQKALPWGDVLLFDYPGYGDSSGRPSAVSFELALTIIIDQARLLADGRPIVFWGHSLGGFVCSKLAERMPDVSGLVLETTARNAAEVARAWMPSALQPFVWPKISPSLRSYDNVLATKSLKVPILVLGAGLDDTLPVSLSRSLAKDLGEQSSDVTYHEFPQALHWNVPSQADYRAVMTAYFSKIESQK